VNFDSAFWRREMNVIERQRATEFILSSDTVRNAQVVQIGRRSTDVMNPVAIERRWNEVLDEVGRIAPGNRTLPFNPAADERLFMEGYLNELIDNLSAVIKNEQIRSWNTAQGGSRAAGAGPIDPGLHDPSFFGDMFSSFAGRKEALEALRSRIAILRGDLRSAYGSEWTYQGIRREVVGHSPMRPIVPEQIGGLDLTDELVNLVGELARMRPREWQLLLNGRAPVTVMDSGAITERIQAAAWAAMNQADVQRQLAYANVMGRVVNPVREGHVATYVPLLTADELALVDQMGGPQAVLLRAADENPDHADLFRRAGGHLDWRLPGGDTGTILTRSWNDALNMDGAGHRFVTPSTYLDSNDAYEISRGVRRVIHGQDSPLALDGYAGRTDILNEDLVRGRGGAGEYLDDRAVHWPDRNLSEWIPDTTYLGRTQPLVGARPVTADGKLVDELVGTPQNVALANGLTHEEAMQYLQARMVRELQSELTSEGGEIFHELTQPALRNNAVHVDDVQRMDLIDRPKFAHHQKEATYNANWYDKAVAKGFNEVISPVIDWLIRKPLFHENLMISWEEIQIFAHRFYDDAARVGVEGLFGGATDDLLERWRGIPEAVRENRLTRGEARKLLDAALGRNARAADELRRSWGGVTELQGTGRRATPGGQAGGARLAELEAERANLVWAIGLNDDQRHALIRWETNRTYADTTMRQLAIDRAVGRSYKYIDDHHIRSQFQDFVKPFAPFWFAEEQFMRRLGRTLMHSPEAARKGQLTMMGLREVGIIKRDEYGNEYYVLPGTGALIDAAIQVGGPVFGGAVALPIASAMTGSVQYSVPSFDRFGIPAASPLLAAPVDALADHFPELASLRTAVVGERAENRNLAQHIIPSHLLRAWNAIVGSPDSSRQMANAQMAALQALAATDSFPDADATPEEINEFLGRLRNWTRTTAILQAALGFTTPASPTLRVEGIELQQEFLDMLRIMPYDVAYSTFVANHPDATAWTVFASEGTTGRALPTSQGSLDWMNDNAGLVDEHPLAAGWLIPTGDAADGFEREAYLQQLENGMRERRSPREMLNEIVRARDGQRYYAMRDAWQRERIRFQNDPEALRQIDFDYHQRRNRYLATHPLFAELNGQREGEARRTAVRQDMMRAFAQPEYGDDVRHQGLRRIMFEWRRFDESVRSSTGRRDSYSRDWRQAVRVQFLNWGDSYTRLNPDLYAFWTTIIRPDIGLGEEELGG
jgi:hypothetical protein